MDSAERKRHKSSTELVPILLKQALDDFDFVRYEEDPKFDNYLITRYNTTKDAVEEFRSDFFFKLAADIHAERTKKS